MATRKTIEEQIAEQEKKKQQLEARIKQLKARQSATERKERTHRLIEIGAIIESGIGVELKEKEQREALLKLLTKKEKTKMETNTRQENGYSGKLKRKWKNRKQRKKTLTPRKKLNQLHKGFIQFSILTMIIKVIK